MLLALTALILTLPHVIFADRYSIVLGLVAAVAIFVSEIRPIPVGYRTNVGVHGSIIFACSLYFDLRVALLAVFLGVATAYLYLNHYRGRFRWYNTTFNISNWVLTTTAASAVWDRWGSDKVVPIETTAIPLALTGIVFVMLNAGLTAAINATRRHQNLGAALLAIVRRVGVTGVVDVLLGTLTAAIVEFAGPPGLILIVIPTLIFYYSLKLSHDLQVQTIEAVQAMADAIDRRDPYTFQHSQRVAIYAEMIATQMRLPLEQVETIRLAARVHDLGKIGINSNMLFKPSALTPEEREAFQKHVYIGAEIIDHFPRYKEGRELILYHHEKWDGTGYPEGLAGEEIPLSARILAVCDAFDAMTSDRPYRRALTQEVAADELRKMSGKQFDPAVVEAFLSMPESQRNLATSQPPESVTPTMAA